MLFIDERKNEAKLYNIHKIFRILKSINFLIFVFGLLIWLFSPMIGILPLLLYCQVNLSLKKKKIYNFVPIILILFTITVFISSFTPFNDTIIYIQTYKNFRDGSFWNSINKYDFEPISFLIPAIVSQLTNGNENWFLFIQSLTMNIFFIGYSILFLPDIYPLVIIINLGSNLFYGQLFLMRHIYSFIFLIPAIYTNNFYFKMIMSGLSFFTHSSSSLPYLLPLLAQGFYQESSRLIGITKFNFFKYYKYIVIILLILVAIFISPITNFFLSLIKVYLAETVVASRVDYYSRGGGFAEVAISTMPLLDSFIILIFIFASKKIKDNFILISWISVFGVTLLLRIATFALDLPWRLLLFSIALPGFFYTIVFESGKFSKKSSYLYTFLILSLVALRSLVYLRNLRNMNASSYYVFFNGEPLEKTIFDYFDFLSKFLFG